HGICINGFCHPLCTAAADCKSSADRCVGGVCQPDLGPWPQCRSNATCPPDRWCVNAVCRTPCGSNGDCGPGCSGTICAQGFCVTPQELAPECARSASCGTGRVCEDAVCR